MLKDLIRLVYFAAILHENIDDGHQPTFEPRLIYFLKIAFLVFTTASHASRARNEVYKKRKLAIS
jgi:hypothetical protein